MLRLFSFCLRGPVIFFCRKPYRTNRGQSRNSGWVHRNWGPFKEICGAQTTKLGHGGGFRKREHQALGSPAWSKRWLELPRQTWRCLHLGICKWRLIFDCVCTVTRVSIQMQKHAKVLKIHSQKTDYVFLVNARPFPEQSSSIAICRVGSIERGKGLVRGYGRPPRLHNCSSASLQTNLFVVTNSTISFQVFFASWSTSSSFSRSLQQRWLPRSGLGSLRTCWSTSTLAAPGPAQLLRFLKSSNCACVKFPQAYGAFLVMQQTSTSWPMNSCAMGVAVQCRPRRHFLRSLSSATEHAKLVYIPHNFFCPSSALW